MKDMNRVKVTVIGVIAALAVNFMGVDKVQAQEFKIQGDFGQFLCMARLLSNRS